MRIKVQLITGFHSETTESEVIQLLKEMIN